MRAPLTVRINDGYTDRHVTSHVTGFGFRKVAPGGYHSLQMRINLPRDFFRDLGPADRVTVYDARTGDVVIEGLTENPGVTDGPAGQSYDLSAMGTMILAKDESRALIYIDRDLSTWVKYAGSAASATAEQSNDPAVTDPTTAAAAGLRLAFNPGQPINTGSAAQLGYNAIADAKMEVGALRLQLKSGKVDADYLPELVVRGGTPDALPLGSGLSTTLLAVNRFVGTHFSGGTRRIALNLRRTGGATNVADDDTWTWFTDVAVCGRRVNRRGIPAMSSTDMVTNQYVRADWVVEDLIGRVLTMCDPDTAVIEPTTFEIDQLAYPDKATGQRVLDDLALWEPDFLWEMLETLPSGRIRFRYRPWPTTHRYEVSTRRDDYRAPGGEVDLCNRIAVFWTDAAGASQVTPVTRSVPELGGAPGDVGARTKDAEPITLPAGKGSAANALRAGQQELAAKADPPTSATVVVRRPLYDRLTGRYADPWELEPGYLTAVRETGEMLRMTEMTYDDESVAATLTLGEPVLTQEQRVARLKAAVALVGAR